MNLVEKLRPVFDGLRQSAPNGVEYWMARDLQEPLGYDRWEKFEEVIKKAQMACESSGSDPDNHFHPTVKMVTIGSGAQRDLVDYYVSRYGAYLTAMNGNPKLPEIAAAQNYFAVQTRRQELADQSGRDMGKRIELRKRVKDANVHLGRAAKVAGVQHWGLFHDAGYRGLYGLGLKDIKKRKGIEKDELLDRAGRAELAMNEFRITQTEEALIRDGVQGDDKARATHRNVGKEVRDTVKKIGGTMPEDLPPEPSIKKLAPPSRPKKEISKSTEEPNTE